MARILRGTRVLLGVSGGIAAYKIVEVARSLTVAEAVVDVLLTRSAQHFVTPLTFETLTRRKVRTEVFETWTETEAGHISLAEEANVFLVAPATADIIAKLAHGLADDMLTVSALACTAPMIVAPAMDHQMYLHPATQANLKTLAERGARIIGPDPGPLASGIVGYGRLVIPERLIAAVRAVRGADGPLAGKRVVVSAGPTREPIDPIRFLSNRSTGKMGYALAEAAIDAGASVTLVTGPTALPRPYEATVVEVETAAQMAEAISRAVQDAHVLIMAAAVADYRPVAVAEHKIKKSAEDLAVPLTRTLDILASIRRPGLIRVGFAAETTHLIESARAKLQAKELDLLIANDATSTMGADESTAYLVRPDIDPAPLPAMSKSDVAERIIDEIVEIMSGRTQPVEGD